MSPKMKQCHVSYLEVWVSKCYCYSWNHKLRVFTYLFHGELISNARRENCLGYNNRKRQSCFC